MFTRSLTMATVAAGVAGLLSLPAARAQQPPPVDAPPGGAQADSDFEVYNRGPLHEAFATPNTNDPVQGRIIERQPPEPIDEVPPEEKPEGDNVQWIPGYWAFDDDLNDFLWVSGVWRDVPPGRTWVPGYWADVGQGYQWVPGMWADADVDQVTYLPEPPESQEHGPSSPSPGEGYFWVPGNWQYYDTGYRWQPGYWAPHQRDWIWVPACYTYTPRGYVYVPGYWDYQMAYRGLAFAPVYFPRYSYGGPFAPTVALNSWGNLMLHLFVNPGYGRYYFGNYYGSSFANSGFLPFYAYQQNYGYDPLFSYYSWRFGPTYYNRLNGWNQYFTTHPDLQPRNTFREQRQFIEQNHDNRVVAAMNVASPLQQVVQSRDLPVAFTKVSGQEREHFTEHARNLQQFEHQRMQVESQPEGSSRASLRIQGNEQLGLDGRNGRPAPGRNVETPERPDHMHNIKPDGRDGQRARVPSPHTRQRPDVREQPGQPDQPGQRVQPGQRGRPETPERPEARDLPRLPEGPAAPGGSNPNGRGQPGQRGERPDRGRQPGQRPDQGAPEREAPPERGAPGRGERGAGQPGERPQGGQPGQRPGQGTRGDQGPPQRGQRGGNGPGERPQRGNANEGSSGAPQRGQSGGGQGGERPQRGGGPK